MTPSLTLPERVAREVLKMSPSDGISKVRSESSCGVGVGVTCGWPEDRSEEVDRLAK